MADDRCRTPGRRHVVLNHDDDVLAFRKRVPVNTVRGHELCNTCLASRAQEFGRGPRTVGNSPRYTVVLSA